MSTIAVDLPVSAEIQGALSEFAETPGKFSVRLKEPALLFRAIKEILVIASGRGSNPGTEPTLSEQHAACFFVKTALLRDGADHYTLLGLHREDADAVIKAHYRLMMRLIHPDFAAAAAAQWPANAATRVNHAYKVLSSPVLRREYDQELGETALADTSRLSPLHGARGSGDSLKLDPQAVHRAETVRRKLRRFVALCGLAAVGLIVYIASSFDRGYQVDLVQRNVKNAPAVEKVSEPKALVIEAEKLNAIQMQIPPASPVGRPPNLPSVDATNGFVGAKSGNVTGGNLTPKSNIVGVSSATSLELQRSSGLGSASKAPAAKPNDATTEAEQVAFIAKDAANPEVSQTQVPKTVSSVQDIVESRLPVAVFARAEPVVSDEQIPQEKQVSRRVTMADAQPLIANLLHQLETGRGNNLLTLMDVDSRRESSSLAFASYYDGLVGGARRVKLSQVELKPESAAGRLLVTGFVRLQLGEETPSTKRLALRVEFASRGGSVVITRLTGTEATDR